MTASPRLAFLLETVGLETAHLIQTNQRLFVQPFDAARAAALKTNLDESERVDACAARFGRLQDTLGDKLLPELLRELAEPVGCDRRATATPARLIRSLGGNGGLSHGRSEICGHLGPHMCAIRQVIH